jgi:DNA-binding MarR family transcriptional regulator
VRRARREDDRRFIQVELTEAGEALIRTVFPQHADAVATDMGVLSAAELRLLIGLCRRLAAGAGPAPNE